MGRLRDNGELHTAVVTGAQSGVGLAIADWLCRHTTLKRLVLTTRSASPATALTDLCAQVSGAEIHQVDLTVPAEVAAFGTALGADTRVDLCINTAGILHSSGGVRPEKRLADIDAAALAHAFATNATTTALLAQALEPALRRSPQATFAALSARVGSISDNRSGGWYAYRASKAALNMLVRTIAIEWSRYRPAVYCVGLHPGTVATQLSAPYTGSYRGTVFAPAESAAHLCTVLDELTAAHNGRCLAWDGSIIDP